MPDLHRGMLRLQTRSSVLPPNCHALSSNCLWWWRWSNIGMLSGNRSPYAHPLFVAWNIILPGRHFPNMHVLPNAKLVFLLLTVCLLVPSSYVLEEQPDRIRLKDKIWTDEKIGHLALCLQPSLETLWFLLLDRTDPVLFFSTCLGREQKQRGGSCFESVLF